MSDAADAQSRANRAASLFGATNWTNLINAIDSEDRDRVKKGTGNSNANFNNFVAAVTGPDLPGGSIQTKQSFMADCWKAAMLARRAQENKPCW